jgi:hypothetical protein
MREPGADLDATWPDSPWNRIAVGLVSEPDAPAVTEADLGAVLMAEAIVAAEEARWLNLDGGTS